MFFETFKKKMGEFFTSLKHKVENKFLKDFGRITSKEKSMIDNAFKLPYYSVSILGFVLQISIYMYIFTKILDVSTFENAFFFGMSIIIIKMGVKK